jgi:hypothetical protein
MIEIIGPRALLAFDGRVLEVFAAEHSRRFHVRQIRCVEVRRGGLLLEDGPTLDLRLIDGRRISVNFADGDGVVADLEQLALLLSVV